MSRSIVSSLPTISSSLLGRYFSTLRRHGAVSTRSRPAPLPPLAGGWMDVEPSFVVMAGVRAVETHHGTSKVVIRERGVGPNGWEKN